MKYPQENAENEQDTMEDRWGSQVSAITNEVTSEFADSGLNSAEVADSDLDYRNWCLMYKDIEVLRFNAESWTLRASCKEYLPYGLRGRSNMLNLANWVAGRATPLNRFNITEFYEALRKEASPRGQVELVCQFGGVSINDCFWIKEQESDQKWENVSPFRKGQKWGVMHRVISLELLIGVHRDVNFELLKGVKPDEYTKYFLPQETTLQGKQRKCLERRGEDTILFKLDDGNMREVEVSKFGKALGLNVVKYWEESFSDRSCSACRISSNEGEQWISAKEIGVVTAKDLFPNEYKAMETFDSIVGNLNRDDLSWGCVANENLELTGLTPLHGFSQTLRSNKMNVPEEIDLELVTRALEYLELNPTTLGAEVYWSNINRLTKAAACKAD